MLSNDIVASMFVSSCSAFATMGFYIFCPVQAHYGELMYFSQGSFVGSR